MSTEFLESDNISSREDIELTEFVKRPDSYYSSSSADFTASCKWPTTQTVTSDDEANDSAVSFLDSSDENHYDIGRASLRSLEGISSGLLTRKALSLQEFSTRRVSSLNSLEGPSSTRISSLDSLERPSSGRDSFMDSLERSLSPRASPLDSLERPSSGRISFIDSLERPSSGRISFIDSLERPSSGRVSFMDSLERSSSRRVSSLDSLERPSSGRISSLDSLERPSSGRDSFMDHRERLSTRSISPLDPQEGPSTRRVSSVDPLEGPSTGRVLSLGRPSSGRVSFKDHRERLSARRTSSLDPQEGPSTRTSSLDPQEGPSTRTPSLDPLEGPSTRRGSSLDPLEGPSTRTNWLSNSDEGSLTSVCQSYHSETDTNEYFDRGSPAERNGYWFRASAWLESFLRRHSRQIRHSEYYPLFLVALIALPYSAGYMGCIYLQLCDGCPKLPYLMYLVGLLGTLIIFLLLIAILSKRYFSPPLTGKEFNTLAVSLCFPFFLFLLVEMATVYSCEPVFIPPHQDFCVKVFYNYAYYANIAVPIVIILLALISVPAHNDPSEAE